MSEVTQLLEAISQGHKQSAEKLLPLVYDELRRLAAARIASERPGQTLQATALVHEAYLRLVDDASAQQWDSRGHFFAAAAEAMRRILVDQARSKQSLRRGAAAKRARSLKLNRRLSRGMTILLHSTMHSAVWDRLTRLRPR